MIFLPNGTSQILYWIIDDIVAILCSDDARLIVCFMTSSCSGHSLQKALYLTLILSVNHPYMHLTLYSLKETKRIL